MGPWPGGALREPGRNGNTTTFDGAGVASLAATAAAAAAGGSSAAPDTGVAHTAAAEDAAGGAVDINRAGCGGRTADDASEPTDGGEQAEAGVAAAFQGKSGIEPRTAPKSTKRTRGSGNTREPSKCPPIMQGDTYPI